MSSCHKGGIPDTERVLLIGAATGVPTVVIVVSRGGLESIVSGLIGGLVVGGITIVGYELYKNHWSITKALANTTLSVGKDTLTSLYCGAAGQ